MAFFVETAAIFGIRHTSVCSPTLWFTWGKSVNLSEVNHDDVLLISLFPKMYEVPAFLVPGIVLDIGDKKIWKKDILLVLLRYSSIAGETGRDNYNWESQEFAKAKSEASR